MKISNIQYSLINNNRINFKAKSVNDAKKDLENAQKDYCDAMTSYEKAKENYARALVDDNHSRYDEDGRLGFDSWAEYLENTGNNFSKDNLKGYNPNIYNARLSDYELSQLTGTTLERMGSPENYLLRKDNLEVHKKPSKEIHIDYDEISRLLSENPEERFVEILGKTVKWQHSSPTLNTPIQLGDNYIYASSKFTSEKDIKDLYNAGIRRCFLLDYNYEIGDYKIFRKNGITALQDSAITNLFILGDMLPRDVYKATCYSICKCLQIPDPKSFVDKNMQEYDKNILLNKKKIVNFIKFLQLGNGIICSPDGVAYTDVPIYLDYFLNPKNTSKPYYSCKSFTKNNAVLLLTMENIINMLSAKDKRNLGWTPEFEEETHNRLEYAKSKNQDAIEDYYRSINYKPKELN